MGNNNQNSAPSVAKKENFNKEVREPLKIENKEPVVFRGELEMKTMVSRQIADEIINPIFTSVFSDYKGCMINVDQRNMSIFVDIYFSKNASLQGGAFEAIREISEPSKEKDTYSRLSRVAAMSNRNKIYELTDEAKEMLEEFMFKSNPNQKIDWKNYYTEVPNNTAMNVREAVAKISGIRMDTILKKAYGYKNAKGDVVLYNITPIRRLQTPTMGFNFSNTSDWLFKIGRLDSTVTNELIHQLGAASMVNGIPMYQV